jgi:hypothetical protein
MSRDQLAGERLHPVQQPVTAYEQGDLRAERLPGRRHLRPHDSAADDEEAARHLVGAGGLPAGPRLGVGGARQIGQGRVGAGADRHGVAPGQRGDRVGVPLTQLKK